VPTGFDVAHEDGYAGEEGSDKNTPPVISLLQDTLCLLCVRRFSQEIPRPFQSAGKRSYVHTYVTISPVRSLSSGDVSFRLWAIVTDVEYARSLNR